jgi:16S rRNA (cytosine1402-N4)-methyltransferase
MAENLSSVHIPILVQPILETLIEPFIKLTELDPPHYLIDCTLGGGGHTRSFLEAFARDPKLRRHRVIAFDQDSEAIERARKNFDAEIREGRLEIHRARFSEAPQYLTDRPCLALMADLGFSSDQIEDPARGLSFKGDGPLDMRLDPSRGQGARDFLAKISELELEKVLSEYGEERFSRRIAQAIVRSRQEKKLPSTTRELAELILRNVPPPARFGRIHAATRTFQALRILVNDELNELDCLVSRVILSLRPGGRVAILSFHSLEDRKVKHAFKERDGQFVSLTKKPIEADDEEIARNPRSRSAKLRVAEKTTQGIS